MAGGEMMDKPEARLVYIKWHDAIGCGSQWEDLDDIKKYCEPLVIATVGWIVADSATGILVVPHMYSGQEPHPRTGQQGCGDMVIPKSAIVSIEDLAVLEPDKTEPEPAKPEIIQHDRFGHRPSH